MRQSPKKPLTDLQLMEKIVDLIIDSEYMKELNKRYHEWKNDQGVEEEFSALISWIEEASKDRAVPINAERAVDKLRAFKRLKDKGFKFNKWAIREEPKTSHIKLTLNQQKISRQTQHFIKQPQQWGFFDYSYRGLLGNLLHFGTCYLFHKT